MKLRLLDRLVCPLDAGGLELVVWEDRRLTLTEPERRRASRLGIEPEALERDVVHGLLVNRRLGVAYPVYRGVPRLLTFRTAVVEDFERRFGERWRREEPDSRPAAQEPMPGEREVLRTFSTEWQDYDWDGGAYWNLSAEDTCRALEHMLELERHPPEGQRLLEAGIGIGAFADHLARHHGCELFGVDLSYAVDSAYAHFGRQPFLHIVQASIFHLPFAAATFDLVYSHGVIHHTFSTRQAFGRLAALCRPGGRLYIWVYNPANERRSWSRRLLMALERVLRPALSPLPTALQTAGLVPVLPLYLLNQNLLARRRQRGVVRYGLREALHAARDRFTPRYAHRHGEEEVAEWFRQAGFGALRRGSERRYPDFVPANFATNTAVTGTREAGGDP